MVKSHKKKQRVLIVDDEPVNIELASAYLKEIDHVEISYALSGKAALVGLLQKPIDLVLLDINMPEMDGFEVCAKLKSMPETSDIPVIFLTAQNDPDFVARAFETGAVDYITKPFRGEELKARVRTRLKLMLSLEELKVKQSKLAELSITDRLTQCYNDLFFQSRLKQMLQVKKSGWFVRIHLRNLEKINRVMGQRMADSLLAKTGKVLRETFFRSDIVARIYAGHFAILVPQRGREDLESLLRTFHQTMKADEALKNSEFVIAALMFKPDDTVAGLWKKSYEKLLHTAEKGVGVGYYER